MTEQEHREMLERSIRTAYTTHINYLYFQLEANKGKLTREQVDELLKKALAKEAREREIHKLPIVGKIIANNKVYTHNNTSTQYKLMLSFMDNLKVDYLDFDILENRIKANENNLYENHYRDVYYKRMYDNITPFEPRKKVEQEENE